MTCDSPYCLIADDNWLIRHSLIRTMRALSRGCCIFLEASDGAEAVSLARTHAPHLVLAIIDEDMPIIAGTHVAEQIKLFCHDAEVVIFSGSELNREQLKAQGIHYFHKNDEVGGLMHFCEGVLYKIALAID